LKRINLSDWKPKRGFWKAIRESLRDLNTRGINLVFVDEGYMRDLKSKFYGKDEVSDVLTFVYDDTKEVIICPSFLGYDDVEIARRIIHGVLHSLGYDHKIENRAKDMMALEEKIFNEFMERFRSSQRR